MDIPFVTENIPWITTAQMMEVDRAMMEDYRIDLVRMMENAAGAPILALDAPFGVDTTTGAVFEPAIRATATVTLALPKEGLRAPGVAVQVGELHLADISVPPALYAEPALNLTVGPIIATNDIVRLL